LEKRPVFVLGCDRSGTSLLRRIFNAHPDIACPTETKFIYQFVKVYETYQSITGLKNMGFTESDVLEQMRVFICHFLDTYARQNGKKRWVEKTTHNVNCTETIDKIFEHTPLYIAIVRHGLDVAYSFATLTHDKFTVIDKYRANGADTSLAAVRHWAVMNRKIVDFQNKAGDRLMLIRYEELTTKPREVLKQVCEFIDAPWDVAMLDYNQREHDTGWEDPNAQKLPGIIANSDKYKNWPMDVQKRLFSEAQDVFEHFNYHLQPINDLRWAAL
jgi:hypothetical protein